MPHSPWLSSLCLALAGLFVSTASAAELRLFLTEPTEFGPQMHAISLDEAGLSKLDEVFARHFACGNGHGKAGKAVECALERRDGVGAAEAAALGKQASITYQLARMVILDPERRRILESVSQLGAAQVLDVQFTLADGVEDLGAGQRLLLPRGGTARLNGPTTLEEVAAEHGVTPADIRRENFRFLEIWPHARSRDGRVRHGGRVLPAGGIYLGEKALETSEGSVDSAWATLIHEASHVSDNAPAPRDNYRYGPSGSHNFSEIIAPHNAFGEGWAYFLPAAWDATNEGYVVKQVVAAEAPEVFLIDDPSNEEYPHEVLSAAEVTASQRLSSEVVVARVLFQIHLGSNVETYEPMMRAFRATNGVAGRHLGDFLKALSRELGDGPHSELVLKVLQSEAGMTRGEAEDFYRNGRFPDGRHGGSAPRVAPAAVGADLPVVQVSRGAFGLFGLD